MPTGEATSFTQEKAEKAVANVLAGAFRVPACTAAGIPRSTFYDWEKYGRQGKEPFKSWLDRIDEAESVLENSLVTEILASKHPSWKARAWLLERRFTRRWGEAIRIKEAARELEEERRPKTELALETVIGLLNDAGYTVTKRDDGD